MEKQLEDKAILKLLEEGQEVLLHGLLIRVNQGYLTAVHREDREIYNIVGLELDAYTRGTDNNSNAYDFFLNAVGYEPLSLDNAPEYKPGDMEAATKLVAALQARPAAYLTMDPIELGEVGGSSASYTMNEVIVGCHRVSWEEVQKVYIAMKATREKYNLPVDPVITQAAESEEKEEA
jgi:hypothetical protein